MSNLKVLAMEPYYGGSHKAFLDGWVERSRHAWTLLTAPASKWKWRMRHAAVTFSQQLQSELPAYKPDVIFCSDMLNLAEWRGLAPHLADVPAVAYFHENQLTYPVQQEDPRDIHFGLTNMITALSAQQVWFNSHYHQESFLEALEETLARMPDRQPLEAVEIIRGKSSVFPPGIDEFPPPGPRQTGPLRLLWVARWEHDKRPEDFFEALRLLSPNIDYRISVIGSQFNSMPEVFRHAEIEFADRIDRWGYQPSGDEYRAALAEADVIVSTAGHEFFGIAVIEAIAAGAYPLLPERLAYPEILELSPDAQSQRFFYSGRPEHLAERISQLAERISDADLWRGDIDRARGLVDRFTWDKVAPELDVSLERMQGNKKPEDA